MITESTNADSQLIFEDLEEFQKKMANYEAFCKQLNNIFRELASEGVVMKKEILTDIYNRGADGLLDTLRDAFEAKKSIMPEAMKPSLVFNPVKFFHKCHVWSDNINWLRSHLRIDTELLDIKAGEVYLPEKSRARMREMYTAHIVSERQKTIVRLIKQINETSLQLASEVSAAGFDPGNCIWDGNFSLLYPDSETGEIRCNYLVLNTFA